MTVHPNGEGFLQVVRVHLLKLEERIDLLDGALAPPLHVRQILAGIWPGRHHKHDQAVWSTSGLASSDTQL